MRTTGRRALAAPADHVLLSLVGVCAVMLSWFDVDLPVVRGLACLVTVSLLPGYAIVSVLPVPRRPATLLAMASGLSLALGTLLTSAALWLHAWAPNILLTCTVAASLPPLLLTRKRAAPVATSTGDRPGWNGGAARRIALQLVPVLVALGLWASSLPRIRTSAMTDFGLVPALPVTYFLGLAVLLVSFVRALRRDRLGLVPAAHLVGLIVMLHGTAPLILPEPHYAWQYKHYGVINYLNLHGLVDESIDIYQGWPGMFALAAWFCRIGGFPAGPIEFAAWAQVYFQLANLVGYLFLTDALKVPKRARWAGAMLFTLGNWVGQDYLAPQALAYVLTLVLYGVTFGWLAQRPRGPLHHLALRIPVPGEKVATRRAGQGTAASLPATVDPPRWAVAMVVVLFAAITATHQLTPYLVLLGVAGLAALDIVRPRALVLGFAVMAVGYLVHDLGFVQQHYGLLTFGDRTTHTTNVKTIAGQGLPGQRWTARATQVLSLVLLLLAALTTFVRLRSGVRETALVLLLIAPAVVLVGQSYGGEGIYRVYLVSLPWAALLAGYGLAWLQERPRVLGLTATFALLLTMTTLFLQSYFGLERNNAITTDEVEVTTRFYAEAPAGSLLGIVVPNFPMRLGARYADMALPNGGDAVPSLISDRRLRHRSLDTDTLPIVEEVLRSYGGRHQFLVVSASQDHYSQLYGLFPPGSLQRLRAALDVAPEWRAWASSANCTIYELLPPSTATAP